MFDEHGIVKYAISSAREEPLPPRPPPSHRTNRTSAPVPSSSRRPLVSSHLRHSSPSLPTGPKPTELRLLSNRGVWAGCGGFTRDGRITVDHPLVDAYIKLIPPKRNHFLENATTQQAKRKRAESEVPTFNQLHTLPEPPSRLEEEILFALAAYKIRDEVEHPKHFSFWAKSVIGRTVNRVNTIIQSRPSLIDVRHTINFDTEYVIQAKQWWYYHKVLNPGGNKKKTYETRSKKAQKSEKKPKALPEPNPDRPPKRKQPERAVAPRKRSKVSEAAQEEPQTAAASSSDMQVDTVDASAAPQSAAPSDLITKEAKLERMTSPSVSGGLPDLGLASIDATASTSVVTGSNRNKSSHTRKVAPTQVASAPVPSRRSARQASKRVTPGSDKATPAVNAAENLPSTVSNGTPATADTSVAAQSAAPGHRRSASSSSGASGSSTAVSTPPSDGTAVARSPAVLPSNNANSLESTIDSEKPKTRGSKRKRVEDDKEEEKPEQVVEEREGRPKRARKATARATASVVEKADVPPPAKKARTATPAPANANKSRRGKKAAA